MRAALIAALLLGAACATPNPQTGRFRLDERSFGVYEVQGRETKLVEETMDVPCELGVAFGVQMTLELTGDRGGVVPLVGELQAPPAGDIRPLVNRITPDPFVVPPGIRSGPLYAGYSFDRPEELVSGKYSVRFYNPDTDMLIYKRTFRVSDCP